MKITYNIEPASRPDRTGRWSIMIRLHQKGQKPGRVLTSVKVEKLSKYWNTKKDWGKWVKGHINSDKINAEILSEYNRVKSQVEKWQHALNENEVLTPAVIVERFRAGVSDRYYDWIDKVVEDAKQQAYATYIAKRSAVNLFKEWAPDDIPLQAVTPVMVRQFQEYLTKSPTFTGAKRKAASVNKILDRMNVIHRAALVKTGVSPKQAAFQSPWTDVESLKETKPKKSKLHEKTIKTVAAVEVPTRRRKVTPESAFAFWMLAYVLAGARFADVMLLRYNQFQVDPEGNPIHLNYEMLKTGNRVSIPIFDEGRLLLKRYWNLSAKPTDYVLPYLSNTEAYAKITSHEQYKAAPFEVRKKLYNTLTHWNRQVNLCLKEVEEKAGLTDKLRTHNARHSFADLARRIMQQDKTLTVYDIQLMLGHSSFKTTEGYYEDGSSQDSSQSMEAIFNRKKS